MFRPSRVDDLFRTAQVNADPFTANFSPSFYLYYMVRFPEQGFLKEAPSAAVLAARGGRREAGAAGSTAPRLPPPVEGYMIGKDEGLEASREYHVHVSAVTVSPNYRRGGLAGKLMGRLEAIGDALGCDFCDLFVRASNSAALGFYNRRGYVEYRTIRKYYANEDGYDMRRSLARDADRASEAPPARGRVITHWVDYPL